MLFDSHVAILLDTAVALVNALTDGDSHGRPYVAPRGDDLPEAVGAALPSSFSVPMDQATYLASTAERMRSIFEAIHTQRVDAAAALVNELLLNTRARPQLDRVPGEPWQVHFHGSDDSVAAGWSAGFASALAFAIGSSLAARLGVCAAAQCDRVYVDSSRNGVRMFCSPACQSRTKAAAFRARRSAKPL